MSRVPNRFIDPLDGSWYDWTINHETEEEFGRQRQNNVSANTGNVGLVRTQGDREPMKLRLQGKILTRAQRDAFWTWFNKCDARTIYFRDVEQNVLEVQITAFNPIRRRAMVNMQDLVNAPTWYYEYTLEMDVFTVISGPLAGLVPA